MGLFDGKVVIVTGAGGGIGRAHALAFALEGAAVVVNDLGGARDGAGQGTRMADAVVEEIKAKGGRAAASYDSVASFEGAKAMVKTAMDAFGRVDILVNNAGILRDKSMLKMEEAMFDIVVAVHLKGTWNCTRHAAEAMIAGGKGGRIINTTSIAGLTGNFGQSNYGPAKAGIWGLTLTAAIELKKHSITVNAVGPMAKTRMTEDISLVPEEMKAEQISPVVLWLASDLAADVTGRTFGVHPPRVFEYKMLMTDGAEKAGGDWTVQELAKELPKIEKLAEAAAPPSGGGLAAAGPLGGPKAPGALIDDIAKSLDELRKAVGGGASATAAKPAAPAPAAAAPSGARDVAAIVDRLVRAAPKYFQKERAGSAKSTFHMHIAGAKPYTIEVAGGECKVQDGHVGTPTCNVKVDAETYVGMAEGKVNPQKAFMEKKLSADNLGEAMKYATLFRQPKPEEIQALIGAAPAAAPAPAAAAAGGARDVSRIVDTLVKSAPKFFQKERAGAAKSTFHMHIAGAKGYTIAIAGGECTVQEGHVGTATCNVKVDADTYVGMAEGKVNPQKAFMEKKLSADNLGEAMKYATIFRQPKPDEIQALIASAGGNGNGAGHGAPSAPAAPAGAAGVPGTPAEVVAQIFRRMPETFVPAKAAGWKAAILWKVAGAGDYTVAIADGKCTTKEGAPEGKPTCTVKLAAETMIGMVTGKVNPQKAFMEGKITADNLADMMKFGGAFDLKKGAEEAAKAVAAAGSQPGVGTSSGVLPGGNAELARLDATKRISAPAPGAGLNRDYIGRSFSGGAIFAHPDHVKLFADATSDPNPRYLGTAEPWVAPPIFPVRLFKECLFRPVTDPGLNADLMRLVHGEQDMRFHRPIKPWDLVTTRAVIHSIEDKSSGQLMKILMKGWVEGELACEAYAGIFIRGAKKAEKKDDAAEAAEARPAPAWSDTMEVAKDQAKRYAEASLDENPIHLDEAVAKMSGLPGIILHGLCTMAFTSRAFVQHACGGNPDRLKRLAVRFSKPVLLGDKLTTTAWESKSPAEGGRKRFEFETKNEGGALVITNGIAEVA